MKLLIFSDLQATDGDETCRANPTESLQHYRVEQLFKDLEKIYKEHQCDGVIDLGDTTDDRTAIPMPTINALGDGLDRIPDSEYNFKLIGNHEHFLRNATINTRHLFKHKFNVVDHIQVYDIDGVTAVFCSYPASHQQLLEWLLKSKKEFTPPAVLFGHFQVVGCQLNNGVALDGIPASALEPFELCFLGHIHIPHTVGERIHYVGSPFQQDWGEAGQEKRVGIWDTAGKVTWVALKGYPQYRNTTWEKFKDLTTIGEHRYRVGLRSHAETELFFQHPLFQQVEPVYDYDAAVVETQKEERDWTFEGTIERYMDLIPPEKVGIEIERQEVKDFGLDLAKGQL